MKGLSTAQRFWIITSLALLATTVAIIFMQWPLRDPAVIADLQSVECSQWREIDPERVYDAYPMTGDPCFALRTLMVHDRVVISSVSDYDEHRVKTGIKRATKSLLTWASLMIGVYVIGWASKGLARKLAEFKARTSARKSE